MEYVIVALLTVCVVLLIVLLLRRQKPDGRLHEKVAVIGGRVDTLHGDVNNEFERNRRETNERLDTMNAENTRFRNEINENLSKALAEMQKSDNERADMLRKETGAALEQMRLSNEQKLEQMRLTVDEKLNETLTQRLSSSFKTVSEQLENVYKSLGEMKELSGSVTVSVTALNRVLTNVKARGTWAEVQLGSILDQTIPGMYDKNFECVAGSGERVEFAVRIPSQQGAVTYLPVDSKFPLEDYVRVCNAADSGDAQALAAARKALIDRVKNEAKTVAKYINVPVTTPYAILYLATDALYAEVLSSSDGTAEQLQRDYSIMIAGPTTITALLNSLAMGFRAVAINEKANEVRLLLGAAKAQYDKFGVALDKVQKKIDEAGKSLEDARNRNRIISRKLSSVEAPDDADRLLGINDSEITENENQEDIL